MLTVENLLDFIIYAAYNDFAPVGVSAPALNSVVLALISSAGHVADTEASQACGEAKPPGFQPPAGPR